MRKNQWTERENKILSSVIIQFKVEGKKFNEAYEYAAALLRRSKKACEIQWTKNLSKTYVTQIDKIKKGMYKIIPVKAGDIQEVIDQTKPSANTLTLIGTPIAPKKQLTQLEMLINSIKTFESENFKVINSGKGGNEFIVINNEEDFGYLVTTEDTKVTNCNCPNRHYRTSSNGKSVICKHMIKVALEKGLDIF